MNCIILFSVLLFLPEVHTCPLQPRPDLARHRRVRRAHIDHHGASPESGGQPLLPAEQHPFDRIAVGKHQDHDLAAPADVR